MRARVAGGRDSAGRASAGAWQDAAASLYHEAQLRRAHAVFSSSPDGIIGPLVAAAERAARAGLRLEPASPDLWTTLGTVAEEVG